MAVMFVVAEEASGVMSWVKSAYKTAEWFARVPATGKERLLNRGNRLFWLSWHIKDYLGVGVAVGFRPDDGRILG
jgi:hypothetical protein